LKKITLNCNEIPTCKAQDYKHKTSVMEYLQACERRDFKSARSYVARTYRTWGLVAFELLTKLNYTSNIWNT